MLFLLKGKVFFATYGSFSFKINGNFTHIPRFGVKYFLEAVIPSTYFDSFTFRCGTKDGRRGYEMTGSPGALASAFQGLFSLKVYTQWL